MNYCSIDFILNDESWIYLGTKSEIKLINQPNEGRLDLRNTKIIIEKKCNSTQSRKAISFDKRFSSKLPSAISQHATRQITLLLQNTRKTKQITRGKLP